MDLFRLSLLSIFLLFVTVTAQDAFADSSNPGAYVPGARTYESWQGVFDVALLEMAMSEKMQNQQVVITDIRWPRNPSSYLLHIISRFHEVGSAGLYVMTANVGNRNGVMFDFVLLEEKKVAVLFNYDSSAILRKFEPIAVVPFEAIGLHDDKPAFGSPGNR